jgi:hypothetical protein
MSKFFDDGDGISTFDPANFTPPPPKPKKPKADTPTQDPAVLKFTEEEEHVDAFVRVIPASKIPVDKKPSST